MDVDPAILIQLSDNESLGNLVNVDKKMNE